MGNDVPKNTILPIKDRCTSYEEYRNGENKNGISKVLENSPYKFFRTPKNFYPDTMWIIPLNKIKNKEKVQTHLYEENAVYVYFILTLRIDFWNKHKHGAEEYFSYSIKDEYFMTTFLLVKSEEIKNEIVN